jgi:hypothetical protein
VRKETETELAKHGFVPQSAPSSPAGGTGGNDGGDDDDELGAPPPPKSPVLMRQLTEGSSAAATVLFDKVQRLRDVPPFQFFYFTFDHLNWIRFFI